MPPEQEVQAPAELPSLRESLESAIETVEKAETTPLPEPQVVTPAPKAPDVEVKDEPKPKSGEEPGTSPTEGAEPKYDQAPKSWKAAARGTWANVPPEARAEIYRRDRDALKTLSEATNARGFQQQMQEVVRPYEARVRASGYSMPQMVGELLKADHLLSTAGPVARAQYMAKLVKDYEVDIRELDSALAGSTPADPVQSAVEKLLNERLSPLQKFVEQQAQEAQLRDHQIRSEASEIVTEMSTDPKYPHFDAVREDMADLLEIASKRGVYLDPPSAYAKAVAMNPELAAHPEVQQQAVLRTAQSNNARAQRAISASQSVTGQPSGVPGAGGSTGSLRDTIEAAFNQVSGR